MKSKKFLAVILAVMMLLCMLPTFAFAGNAVTIQVSNGVPAAASGSGWMYSEAENTVYLYSGGDFAFTGDALICNVNSNSNITSGIFNGEVFSFGGKISGGTYMGTVKSRFDTVTGGMFCGAFDNMGSTVTGGVFGADALLPSGTYSLVILNGHIKNTDLTIVQVFPGTTVNIEANAQSESFANWISFSDVPVVFADAKSSTTSFVMPEGDVNIIAADVSDNYNPDTDTDADGDIDFDDLVSGGNNSGLEGIISTVISVFFTVIEYIVALLDMVF